MAIESVRSGLNNMGETIGEALEPFGFDLNDAPECCDCCTWRGITRKAAAISVLALFVIGCMAASGTFPGSSLGWVTMGIGVGALTLKLVGKEPHRKVQDSPGYKAFLVTAILITLGALGVTGVLSTSQVGLGIIGTLLASKAVGCCGALCRKTRKLKPPTEPNDPARNLNRQNRVDEDDEDVFTTTTSLSKGTGAGVGVHSTNSADRRRYHTGQGNPGKIINHDMQRSMDFVRGSFGMPNSDH